MPKDEQNVDLGFLSEVPILGGSKSDYDAQKEAIKGKIVNREVKAACFLKLIELLTINPGSLEEKAALFDRMKGMASLGFPEISLNVKTVR